MNLKQFQLHPLIPLRTPHLTLISLDQPWEDEERLLTSDALPLPTPEDGLQPEILLWRVVVTTEQRTIGFAQVGSTLYYRSLAARSSTDYRRELLNVLLNFSFLVLDKTAVQLLNQPDNLLIEAYTTEYPKALVQIARGAGITIQRTGFYPPHRITTTSLTLAAVALLLRNDGAILLSQPPAGKREVTSWELPGGKVISGEIPAEALVRELQEELGITVSVANLVPLLFATEEHSRQRLVVHFYLSTAWTQELTAQEQQSLTWVLPEQIHHYPMRVEHQVAFYQLAYLLGRYSIPWRQYAQPLFG